MHLVQTADVKERPGQVVAPDRGSLGNRERVGLSPISLFSTWTMRRPERVLHWRRMGIALGGCLPSQARELTSSGSPDDVHDSFFAENVESSQADSEDF